jgi:hypothetical protein
MGCVLITLIDTFPSFLAKKQGEEQKSININQKKFRLFQFFALSLQRILD